MKLFSAKRHMKLTRLSLLGGVVTWWLAFLWLRSMHSMPEVVVNTVGFGFLAIVPGMLTTIALKVRTLAPWGKLAISIGFSILELMVVALLGNTILQWF